MRIVNILYDTQIVDEIDWKIESTYLEENYEISKKKEAEINDEEMGDKESNIIYRINDSNQSSTDKHF